MKTNSMVMVLGAVAALLFLAVPGCASPEESGPCVAVGVDAAGGSAATADASATADAEEPCVTCPGAPVPALAAMRDFQPKSCRFGERYSLDSFRGRTTVVALLAAW